MAIRLLVALFLGVGMSSAAANDARPAPSQKPQRELPTIDSVPPPSSSLYLALPSAGPDPLKIAMPNGPFAAAQRDINELRGKYSGSRDCLAVTIAGMEATRDRNLQSAEEFLQRALASECDDGMATFYLGTLQEYRGRYQQALGTLQIAREQIRKNYPDHRYVSFCDATLGRTYFRLGRYEEAQFFLNRMLKLYPDDLPHLYYYGASLLKAGNSGEGVGPLQKVVALSRSVPYSNGLAIEASKNLAGVYWQLGQLSSAEFYVDRALEMTPRNAELLRMKAQIFEARRSGRYRGGPAAAPPPADLQRGFGNGF